MQALILSLTLVCGCLALSWTASSQDVDIDSLAKLVCETNRGTKRQISHVSHISQLVQFFQGLTSEHKLQPCRNLYLQSLEELERVLSTANDNACGDEKIKLVEEYHRKYVSKVSKYVRQQKRHNKAPRMVKLFFMQYANRMSSICEDAAVSFIKKHQRTMSQDELAKIDGLKKFTDALGMSDFSSGFKGVYLFWNMVDSLGLESDKKFSKYLDTDGPFRLRVQMREARKLRGVQSLCRNKFRPSYSRSVLPVLRLVDMGYYPKSQQLLADEPKMRPIFLATQICETLLPMQVFEDDKLTSDQFVALTKEEVSTLASPEEIEGLGGVESVEVASVSAAYLDELIGHDTAQADADRIKANVSSRSKIIRRMLRNLLKQLKAKLGASLSKNVLFKRGANQQLELMPDENIDKIDEDQLLQSTEDDVDDDETGVAGSHNNRPKRGFWSSLGYYSLVITVCLYLTILTLIKIVLLFVPTIILMLISLFFDYEPAFIVVEYMWKFGIDPTNPIPDDIRRART